MGEHDDLRRAFERTPGGLVLEVLAHQATGWIACALLFLTYALASKPVGGLGIFLMIVFGLIMAASWSIAGAVRRDVSAVIQDATQHGVRLRIALVVSGAGRATHQRLMVVVEGELPTREAASEELRAALDSARAAGWKLEEKSWRFDQRIWLWTDRRALADEAARGVELAQRALGKVPTRD